MDKIAALSQDAIGEARALFDDGHSLASIAAHLELHPATLARGRKAWAWPARRRKSRVKPAQAKSPKQAAKAKTSATAGLAEQGTETCVDTVRLLRAVRRAVAHELKQLGEGATGEARARTLASLTRTLDALRSVEGQIRNEGTDAGRDADEPPVDIAELRRELARRLDRLRGARGTS